MTTTDTDLTERIARALHADDAETGHAADEYEAMSAASIAWYRSNAAAVLPLIAAEVRKAQAEAWDEGSGGRDDLRPNPCRADQIEEQNHGK